MDADEFGHNQEDDYPSSYESSYRDEISLSTSVEKEYMYRRNAGHSPKLNDHFFRRSNSVGSIPEEDVDGISTNRSSTADGKGDSDDEDTGVVKRKIKNKNP